MTLQVEKSHRQHSHGMELSRQSQNKLLGFVTELATVLPLFLQLMELAIGGVLASEQQVEHGLREWLLASGCFLCALAELGDGVASESNPSHGVEGTTIIEHEGEPTHAKHSIIDLHLSNHLLPLCLTQGIQFYIMIMKMRYFIYAGGSVISPAGASGSRTSCGSSGSSSCWLQRFIQLWSMDIMVIFLGYTHIIMIVLLKKLKLAHLPKASLTRTSFTTPIGYKITQQKSPLSSPSPQPTQPLNPQPQSPPIPQTQPSPQQLSTQAQSQSADTGTEYTNWVLARSVGHNHNIQIQRRRFPKDRYSIHRLTNIKFMENLIKFDYKYNLTMNQKIVLLAQFNHVLQVLGRPKKTYQFEMNLLVGQITSQTRDPPDLICMGTLMSSLTSMSFFGYELWLSMTDDILVHKFDEEYDQLFGIVIGLYRYREHVVEIDDYERLRMDEIIPKMPIIYRNNLNTLRQFVTHNIYNLKQARLLFEALYAVNINEGYFWDSVRDWFNIYTKQQLGKKVMDEYFIMKESAVERVLHDHGIIRPRPILQELSSIVYILSEFGTISWRFIEFSQDLVLYAIDHGSQLYKNFRQIQKKQEEEMRQLGQNEQSKLNRHMKAMTNEEKQNLKNMEKKYKTIFINPIALKDHFVIYYLVVLSRAYKMYRTDSKEQQKQKQKDEAIDNQKQLQKKDQKPDKQKQKQKSSNFYDRTNQVYLDPRVKRWLLLQLVKAQNHYTVKQLIQIHKCSQFLSDSNINVQNLIAQKLSNLRITNTSFAQIKQLMSLLSPMRYNKLNQVLIDFLLRNHPSQILKFTKYIEQQNLFPYMGDFLMRLPKAVNYHEKYFSFEENCYFLYTLLKNAYSIDSIEDQLQVRITYEGHMEQLKEAIKIVAYGRGFKISVNSYFHKILDYIDVVEFFQGGR